MTFGELIKDLIREPLISDDKSVRASNKPESLSNIISMKSNTSFYQTNFCVERGRVHTTKYVEIMSTFCKPNYKDMIVGVM